MPGSPHVPLSFREKAIVAFIVVACIYALALLFGIAPARAHSFYPWECCHDRDCWLMGPGEREPEPASTRDGWLLFDGTLVLFRDARPSPDGRFHVCRSGGTDKGSVIRPAGAPVCLFVPMGAS